MANRNLIRNKKASKEIEDNDGRDPRYFTVDPNFIPPPKTEAQIQHLERVRESLKKYGIPKDFITILKNRK
ncbi:hypothetical protein [Chitinophaga tropicalis]|uniref:Uncharacterized protein n=1 Tax=Chitinophaga tropicalis TaxID=2683588 RepID=A0A7K1U7F1_9BACT|nr:hypothetical protein [Chitinophaga tropicalis]MVT09925.1 hypothetical protein [Chitinophaga tropicalis]